MKLYFLIGNWKSNKTTSDGVHWLTTFNTRLREHGDPKNSIEIMLFVPFTLLPVCAATIGDTKMPIKLGAQDISPYPMGAYTGEVNGKQLAEFASLVMIGHSERRNNSKENDDILFQKTNEAVAHGLNVIYCVQNETTPVPRGAGIVLYEPPQAIGTGNAQSPQEAAVVCENIYRKVQGIPVIYGGSVTADNVISFITHASICGVGVGKASLDPEQFFNLYKQIAALPA